MNSYPTMGSKLTSATNEVEDFEYDAPFAHSFLNLLLLAYYPMAKNSLEIFPAFSMNPNLLSYESQTKNATMHGERE
jgi:hypothetical protein